MFCGASCRQRAYEARRRAAHPAATPGITHDTQVPRIASLLVTTTSHEQPIFTPEDVEALLQKIGKTPREGTDLDLVAENLTRIAEDCVDAHRRGTAPTAGEYHKRFSSIERHVSKSLEYFDLHGSLDHLNGNGTVNSVNALIRCVPANDRLDFYLRDKIAREIGASEVPSEWRALRVCLLSLQYVKHRLQLAVAQAQAGKGAPREVPPEEINLVAPVRDLYVEVTGDKNSYTNDPIKDTQGSSLVDFISGVAVHIHDHLAGAEPPAPADLRRNLKALGTKRRRIIERLRQIPKDVLSTEPVSPPVGYPALAT
jgi:hypothetical protein